MRTLDNRINSWIEVDRGTERDEHIDKRSAERKRENDDDDDDGEEEKNSRDECQANQFQFSAVSRFANHCHPLQLDQCNARLLSHTNRETILPVGYRMTRT